MLEPRIFTFNPILYFPRPDLLPEQIQFRRRSKVDTNILEEILAEFSLSRVGNTEATAEQGRSENWIIETSTGKKMLKRYKEVANLEEIVHEHSILNYLDKVGFPAPRLTQAANGRTIIEKGGRYYALFNYLDGYFHFHSYLFTPDQTRQFIAASAESLGILHTVLNDFIPEGCNPNGFKSRQGDRWRELPWFEERLNQCKQGVQQPRMSAIKQLRRSISEEVDWVEGRLHDLDGIIKNAAPRRMIIHGDFGPYNVFFKPGAPVTILDFELARLDWRLTDLSNAMYFFALARRGFNFRKMVCFLEAYQNVFRLDPQELELLPKVWQFLLLRRTIVCWHSFLNTQSGRWLEEAERKLHLAHWINRNQKRLSNIGELD